MVFGAELYPLFRWVQYRQHLDIRADRRANLGKILELGNAAPPLREVKGRWFPSFVVHKCTSADRAKLRALDDHQNCRRELPIILIQRLDHLIDQGLV